MKRTVSSEVVSRNRSEIRGEVKPYSTVDRRRTKPSPVVPPRPAAVVTAKHPSGPGQNPQQRKKQQSGGFFTKWIGKGRKVDVTRSLPTAGTQGTVHQAYDAVPCGVYGPRGNTQLQRSPQSPGAAKEQLHNSRTFMTIIDARGGRVDYESTNGFVKSSSQSNKSPGSGSAPSEPGPRVLSSGAKSLPKLKHSPSNTLVQKGSNSVPISPPRRDLLRRPNPKRPGPAPVRPPLPIPHSKAYSAPHTMRPKHRSPSPEYSYVDDLGTKPQKRSPSPEYSYVDPENVSGLAKHGEYVHATVMLFYESSLILGDLVQHNIIVVCTNVVSKLLTFILVDLVA